MPAVACHNRAGACGRAFPDEASSDHSACCPRSPAATDPALENGGDIKFAGQLIQASLKRWRYRNAARAPLDPLVMALLAGEPDTLGARQSPGVPDRSYCDVDILLE